MGPKGESDTKTNWSNDCRPQDELHLHHRQHIPTKYTKTKLNSMV
jgi:hypothetical protein